MNNNMEKVQPFDSFTAVCKIMVWTGNYKLSHKQTTPFKRISHQIYRYLVLILVTVYNVQHWIFTVQHRHDMGRVFDCLVIEIPQINTFVKFLNMLIQTQKLDEIYKVLTGPNFAATNEQDEAILKRNKLVMDRLNRFLMTGVSITSFVWTSSYFVKRYYDENEVVNSYMPFETDSWSKFALSVFLETGFVIWVGYGVVSHDNLIAAYYAQAQTQLKIIKNQLETLSSNRNNRATCVTSGFRYIDLRDETIYKKFVQIVKRYKTLVWYKNKIDSAFSLPLTVQLLSTATIVCMVIYRMTTVRIASFQFMLLAMIFMFLLIQVLLYCYFGNHVEFESQLINNSAYSCDWESLSPLFRRSLLVAMGRWSRPIQPRVCGIIPLSLNTFLQIVKSSYSLYTFLVFAADPEAM